MRPWLRQTLRPIRSMLRRRLLGPEYADEYPPDFTPEEREIIASVRPYTMTSPERLVTLIHAVRYVVRNKIPGAFVECGVWRGGSMMTVAETLAAAGDTSRELYLYDTFEGMSPPTTADQDYQGQSAADLLQRHPRTGKAIWCYAGLDDVRTNVLSTGYPERSIHFVQGKVEDTIPARTPAQIALLRLDTDWYESTKHELTHLYPRLSPGGVLIIDDYGHWKGAREATDEYFAAHSVDLYLHRIDYTARMGIKMPAR